MSNYFSKKMNISFDWDNTISMSYMDEESEDVKFIHQGYNQEFIDRMLNYIKEGHNVFIVTSRVYKLEADAKSLSPSKKTEDKLKKTIKEKLIKGL